MIRRIVMPAWPAWLACLACLAWGCPGPGRSTSSPSETVTTREDEVTRLRRMLAELQDDVLTSYERDEPPDQATALIDPRIGPARIGAGPGDVYIAGDLARAPSRWPLDLDHATRTEVRSKNLAIQVAADQSAAWVTDEVSWRIEMCSRTAVIPLRMTALYAHDGDRWISVLEHLSFGWPATPRGAAAPRPITSEVVSGELEATLQGIVERGLLRTPRDPAAVAQDTTALVLGPDASDEWAAAQVAVAQLPAGQLEGRRIGTIGRRPGEPTIAYWVGNFLADVPARPGVAAGKVAMRATFVFERRPTPSRDRLVPDPRACAAAEHCRWVLVQAHLSQPISDEDLTAQVFGTAMVSPKPLALDCSDGTLLIAPVVGPRQAPRPPQEEQSRQSR